MSTILDENSVASKPILVETLCQIVRNYERQSVRLDILEAVPDYKDPRHIDARVELRDLDDKFHKIVKCVKEAYGQDVTELLLSAADQLITAKLGE